MNQTAFTTPVLIIAFRREDTTRRVLEAVRLVKPSRLYVACNAPRPGNTAEQEQCAAVRRLFEMQDWPCEVHRLFREQHLSARDSISGAISWFFEQEPQGIILEDDCVPSPSFFRFAEELLNRYANDLRIGMISGDNFQFGRRRGEASYYFSRYSHIWGWATWRNRWTDYELNMESWPDHRLRVLKNLDGVVHRRYWGFIMDRTYAGLIDTWDYQWVYTNWLHNRVSVMPQVNLVSNIGFGNMAHHTHRITRDANIPALEMNFPLRHPDKFLPDPDADRYTFRKSYLPGLGGMARYVLRMIGWGARKI